jgi:redox-sensitive bicupin YhaK (pirin superfamily)
VSYVLDGALAHKDSIGNGATIVPGEVQRMTAGRGIAHSEYNRAADRTTHFLQIWILPQRQGLAPGYEQKAFAAAEKRGRLRLVASPDGRDGSVQLNADAELRAGLIDGDERAELALDPKRLAYVHVARGLVHVNGQLLSAGDAAMLDGETRLVIDHGREAEVLAFDLAR